MACSGYGFDKEFPETHGLRRLPSREVRKSTGKPGHLPVEGTARTAINPRKRPREASDDGSATPKRRPRNRKTLAKQRKEESPGGEDDSDNEEIVLEPIGRTAADTYSPFQSAKRKRSNLDDDEEYTEPPTRKNKSTFSKADKEKRKAKKAFDARKIKLAEDFLKEVDYKMSRGKITRLTKSTGGVKLAWKGTLRATAGRTKYERYKLEPNDDNTYVEFNHYATIELSSTAVDNEEKLYNVICHEWCHLASLMISDVRKPYHGAQFKNWGAKCTSAFSHLNVEVTTLHYYDMDIDCKYRWSCQSCGHIYGRHTPAIDPARRRCGRCKGGELVQTHPLPKEKRQLTEYQLFVKENFARIKRENPGTAQNQLLKLVGSTYRTMKGAKRANLAGNKGGAAKKGGAR